MPATTWMSGLHLEQCPGWHGGDRYHHPVPTREAVRKLKAPAEIKPELRHGFMYLRLGDLRGFEEVMLDFAEDAPELQMLIDTVLEHNVQRLELMCQKWPKEELYWFGDDLGMQTSLAMGAPKWRKYLKPCFMKIFQRWRADGRMVFFHTDGCCWESFQTCRSVACRSSTRSIAPTAWTIW